METTSQRNARLDRCNTQDDAIELLRRDLCKGDTIHFLYRTSSFRKMCIIDPIVLRPVMGRSGHPSRRECRPWYLGYVVAKALGLRHDVDRGGVVVHNPGYSHNLWLIKSISQAVFGIPDALGHDTL